MKPIFISFASVLPLSLATAPALAKNCTIGIYGIIDRVTFGPSNTSPKLVRIAGVFVVPIPLSSCGYKTPQRGYLYFRTRPGMEQATREEWNALKAAAGTGRVVGFADYWVPNPKDSMGNPHTSLNVRVHSFNDGGPPRVYPLPYMGGVVDHGDKANPDFSKIAEELKTAAIH